MNSRTKKRLIGVSGAIVIVLIVVLAIVGGGTAAKTISVAEAAELADGPDGGSQKVQVSGNVLPDSYSTENGVLKFQIYEPGADADATLHVIYDGAAASTFGNDVTAICTGKISQGALNCTELVTKCPSKYENSASALTVQQLAEYGDDVQGKVVKVAGIVQEGTLSPAGNGDRFAIADEAGTDAGGTGASTTESASEGEGAQNTGGTTLAVVFDGALSDEVCEGATVVLTGSVGDDGKFKATEVALEK